ncbi:MAG: putative holin [Rhodanobacter sp.]
MAEPTTAATATLVVAGVSLATLLPGVDGNAVIGAFAGAALMALHARDVSVFSRIAYLFISWIMGYLAAPLVMRQVHLQESGVAAFLAAAIVIAVTVQLIERIKAVDLAQWFSWLRRGGP